MDAICTALLPFVPVNLGEVDPYIVTLGTLQAAAKCANPVSTAITALLCVNISSSANSDFFSGKMLTFLQ